MALSQPIVVFASSLPEQLALGRDSMAWQPGAESDSTWPDPDTWRDLDLDRKRARAGYRPAFTWPDLPYLDTGADLDLLLAGHGADLTDLGSTVLGLWEKKNNKPKAHQTWLIFIRNYTCPQVPWIVCARGSRQILSTVTMLEQNLVLTDHSYLPHLSSSVVFTELEFFSHFCSTVLFALLSFFVCFLYKNTDILPTDLNLPRK